MAAIRYLVKDVDRSIAFYTELLAFKVAHQAKPAFASVARDDLAAEGAEDVHRGAATRGVVRLCRRFGSKSCERCAGATDRRSTCGMGR
jgi:catechol 2,3-dioxygenase-like lactoylglutathione lyase family enzyme